MSLLKGKIALVTGAARGIGKATAKILSGEGAVVAVADVLPEVSATAGEIERENGRSAFAIFDISDPERVAEGVREIREDLGDIDILVNNAGIVNNIAPLRKMTHEAWRREISVNLSGAFNMIQETIGAMIEKKWGRIVNVSSLGATGGLHNQAAYAASKAGLLGLTKTVTLEHAKDGITCNAVLPGLIGTELVQAMPEEIVRAATAMIPSSRLGQMEEVGHMIAFLACDGAGFINGEEIHVDGGMRLNMTSLSSRRQGRERDRTGN